MSNKTEATEAELIQPKLLIAGGWIKDEPIEWSPFLGERPPLSYYKDFGDGDGDGATSVTFTEKLTIVTICDMDDNEIKVTGIQTMKQLQTLHLALSGQPIAPTPVTPQKQKPEARRTLLEKLHLKRIIHGPICNTFDTHPEIKETRAVIDEIYTNLTRCFELIKKPTIGEPAEAGVVVIDFEAIDSLLDVRRNYLDKKPIEDLSESETIELIRINDVLDGLETQRYRPIKAELKRIEASIAKQQETEAEFDYERMANNLLLAIMNAEKGLRPNERGVYSPLSATQAGDLHLWLLIIQHYDQNKRLMATYGVKPYIVPDTDEAEDGADSVS